MRPVWKRFSVNDQIRFDADFTVSRLANNKTVIDANNTLSAKTNIWGHMMNLGMLDFKAAGFYSLFLVGGSLYTDT